MHELKSPRSIGHHLLCASAIFAGLEKREHDVPPTVYLAAARWSTKLFHSLSTPSLWLLLREAPAELRVLIENVIHSRNSGGVGVKDPLAWLAAASEYKSLVVRCRLPSDAGRRASRL